MTSRFARIAAAFSLIVLLAACHMNVQISTHVNGKGGGTLGLTILVDKELRDVLEAPLAEAILRGDVSGGDNVVIEIFEGSVRVRRSEVTAAE